jgi:hypothetical protein
MPSDEKSEPPHVENSFILIKQKGQGTMLRNFAAVRPKATNTGRQLQSNFKNNMIAKPYWQVNAK